MSASSDQREEMPRITVDKLRDWERIKKSYTNAAYANLESRIASRSEVDKRMLRTQLQRVRPFPSSIIKPAEKSS